MNPPVSYRPNHEDITPYTYQCKSAEPANVLNLINHSKPSHTELMGPEREVFGALMVRGIDGQSPGMVDAQFRFSRQSCT